MWHRLRLHHFSRDSPCEVLFDMRYSRGFGTWILATLRLLNLRFLCDKLTLRVLMSCLECFIYYSWKLGSCHQLYCNCSTWSHALGSDVLCVNDLSLANCRTSALICWGLQMVAFALLPLGVFCTNLVVFFYVALSSVRILLVPSNGNLIILRKNGFSIFKRVAQFSQYKELLRLSNCFVTASTESGKPTS